MAFPIDKRQHLVGGAAVGLGTLVLLWAAPRIGQFWAATLAGAAVGFGFEWLQAYRREGVPDPRDAVAATAGASVIGAFVQWLWPVIQRGL